MSRIAIVITARASYARVKTALEAMRASSELDPHVVLAGSALLHRYGDLSEQIERDGYEYTSMLSGLDGGTPEAMVKSTGLLTIELGSLFARMRPDAVMTIADRHETLATAIAASYQNITLVHLQGGEVTGSIDDRVRDAITQLADIHFVAESRAHERIFHVARRGQLHLVGCPSIDIAARAEPLDRLEAGTGAEIDLSQPFLIVMQHPVTTEWHEAWHQIPETGAAVNASGLPAVWFWPNADAGTEDAAKQLRIGMGTLLPKVRFIRNLEPEAFCGLAKRAACIVGNSSFGIREASYLGLPAVNIGSRQNGRERAKNVVDVPHDSEAIRDAIKAQVHAQPYPSNLYGDGKAGERIARYLEEELGKRRVA